MTLKSYKISHTAYLYIHFTMICNDKSSKATTNSWHKFEPSSMQKHIYFNIPQMAFVLLAIFLTPFTIIQKLHGEGINLTNYILPHAFGENFSNYLPVLASLAPPPVLLISMAKSLQF